MNESPQPELWKVIYKGGYSGTTADPLKRIGTLDLNDYRFRHPTTTQLFRVEAEREFDDVYIVETDEQLSRSGSHTEWHTVSHIFCGAMPVNHPLYRFRRPAHLVPIPETQTEREVKTCATQNALVPALDDHSSARSTEQQSVASNAAERSDPVPAADPSQDAALRRTILSVIAEVCGRAYDESDFTEIKFQKLRNAAIQLRDQQQ